MKITTVQINEDEGVQKTKKSRSRLFQVRGLSAKN